MQTSVKDFKEFYNAIKNDELVFLFGTGISSALTGKPYSWQKWVFDGISLLKDRHVAADLRASLEEDDSTANTICVVGKVLNESKADGSYARWMQESFEMNSVTNEKLAEVLNKLLILQDTFATTNYDLLLEKVTGLDTLTYNNPDAAFEMLDKHLSTHILHIHGMYDSERNRDDIVADEAQYDSVIANLGAQFIQGILGTRTLIFVGCGKTTEDANISRFVQFANEHLKMRKKYYFLYNSSKPVDDLPENIVPVPYGSEYSDLTSFLDELATERICHKIAGKPLIGRTVLTDVYEPADALLKYHYSQRIIPLCGRKLELENLTAFIEADNAFSWWVITGQAGSGKSRLAFEFLYNLPPLWFGFFLADGGVQQDIEQFIPFCNTLVVIDYVSGRERFVSAAILGFLRSFEKSNYKLRILLLERENSKREGSWYAKLLQRISRDERQTIESSLYDDRFLNLTDLNSDDVRLLIAGICTRAGLDEDFDRDAMLMDMYDRKFEQLRFRPLFVQLFVEAWINDEHGVPRYDSYTDVLKQLLQKEQEKWLVALDNDQIVCNAFIHLLLRAIISGKLDLNNLPDYYKSDGEIIKNYIARNTFPGIQRNEHQISLVNQICQNIDEDNEFISPLFPDLLKEYMFYFYMEEERLAGVMTEIWQHAASDFSVFITRCIMDFPEEPFYQRTLNVARSTAEELETLVGRVSFLQNRLIQKGEDPQVYLKLIENEYAFWHSLVVPDEGSEKADLVATTKIAGLNRVATQIGAWSLYDVSDMVQVLDEMIEVKGGLASEELKKLILSDQIKSLATHSFSDEALYFQNKLDNMLSDSGDEFDNMLLLQGENVKMMDSLLAGNMKVAYGHLETAANKCRYEYLESARLLAHSVFNYENIALQIGERNFIRKALPIAQKIELLYPEDPVIRARRIGAEASDLTFELLSKKITKEEAREKGGILEQEIRSLTFDGTETDESLGISWGSVKMLKINIATEEELHSIIEEADDILRHYPRNAEVASTAIVATRALHEEYLKTKVTHGEVEKLYKYVEVNYDSGAVRNVFFEMLEESEDAHCRKNYLTEDLIREARQDARYNPMMGSGLPEYDMESDLLWDFAHPQIPYVREHRKVGANEPCPCGSGRKFKKCCRGNGMYD